MQQTVLVSQLRPNPFREMDRYPIQRDKVDALRESFRSTGFWGNIVARQNGKGYEIAYGHHRLLALKEELGVRAKVSVIIQDLSDEVMLKMMIRENMQEYRSSAYVDLESVRAVVQAFGNGVIVLEVPSRDTPRNHIRHAPSFRRDVSQDSGQRPYTGATVGRFLGWERADGKASTKVLTLLNALELIELGAVKESKFKNMTLDEAEIAVRKGMADLNQYIKKDSAKAISAAQATMDEVIDEFAEKKKQRRDEKAAQKGAARARQPKQKKLPDIEDFARRLGSKVADILSEDHVLVPQLNKMIEHVDRLTTQTRKDLALELKLLADRALAYSNAITTSKSNLTVQKVIA